MTALFLVSDLGWNSELHCFEQWGLWYNDGGKYLQPYWQYWHALYTKRSGNEGFVAKFILHRESKMKINVFLQAGNASCVSWDGKGTFIYDYIDQFLLTNLIYFIYLYN